MPDIFATSVRLSEKLKSDLVRFARAQGCSVTWLIADVMTKWVEWKKEQDKKK